MTYHSNADLGGQDGFGLVKPDHEEEMFHASWEPRVLALTLAMGATGLWNIDISRAARETLPDYRSLSYYQIWLAGLEKLLIQTGAMQAALPVRSVLSAERVASVLARGAPTVRPPSSPALFTMGQPVRTKADVPTHHTRLPGYARGKRGIIERVHGSHVFADAHARGLGEQPQWLYTVTFEERELWGDSTSPQQSRISVDAWESYLESA
jgi:nitrile hydratase subunit beta